MLTREVRQALLIITQKHNIIEYKYRSTSA